MIEPAGGHRQGTKTPIFFGILPFGASPGECLTVGIARLKARNPSSPSSLSRAHPPISPRPAPARDSVFPRDASGLRRHTLRQRARRHRAPTLGPSSPGPASLGPPSLGPRRSVAAQTPIVLGPPSRSDPQIALGPPSLAPPSLVTRTPVAQTSIARASIAWTPIAQTPLLGPARRSGAPTLLGPCRSHRVARTLSLVPGCACAFVCCSRPRSLCVWCNVCVAVWRKISLCSSTLSLVISISI